MSATSVVGFSPDSRGALVGTSGRLSELAADAEPDALLSLGDELDSVADLFDREVDLRRAATASTRDPSDREGLISQVLGEKVGGTTREVVRTAVRSTWTHAEDLVAGLRRLAQEAMLASAENAGRLDTVEDELFRLGRIIGAEPRLERLLGDPAASSEGKRHLVDRLLADRADQVTVRLAERLVTHPEGRGTGRALERLAELAAERRNRSVATVRSAVELTDAQQERLAGLLARIYRREIAVHLQVDPDLLGGLVIQVGDEVIDGSAAGRLDDLGRRLG